MDWVEHISSAVTSPTGQFLLGLAVLVLGPTALLSEKTVREKFGALGLVARWFYRMKATKAERELAEEDGVTQCLKSQLAELQEMLNERTAALQDQIDDLHSEGRKSHGYILYITRAIRSIEIWAANNSYDLPSKTLLTYPEWEYEFCKEV